MYENGQGVPQSFTKAIELYEQAAAKGNVNAMFNLGSMYKNGRQANESGEEVVQNKQKAKQWFEQAAAHGDAEAAKILEELNASTDPRSATASSALLSDGVNQDDEDDWLEGTSMGFGIKD